ncbi:MAG: D-mannonate oxidoreductase, partial [Deltaproteobacteria bacterium]|nr:D-mannonate oxidoreductase [Deltaproteobacteria bacterium]
MDLEKLTRSWDFAGQTIVMPGGAGILGSEMAYALVKCGANVVILDRDLSKADALKKRFS